MTVEFYDGQGRMPENTLLVPGNTYRPQSMTEYLGWFSDGTTKDIMEEIIRHTGAFLQDRSPESVEGWVFKVGGRYHVSFTAKAWEDLITAILVYEQGKAASA